MILPSPTSYSDERKKCDRSRSLYSCGELALMFCTGAGDSSRQNFPPLCHISSQLRRVLIVYFFILSAKATFLLSNHDFLFPHKVIREVRRATLLRALQSFPLWELRDPICPEIGLSAPSAPPCFSSVLTHSPRTSTVDFPP